MIENRRLYVEKFEIVTPLLSGVFQVKKPEAALYLWAINDLVDTEFALRLYRDFNERYCRVVI